MARAVRCAGATRPKGAIALGFDALLRDGRAQHVPEERLPAGEVCGACVGGGVEREAVERSAERLVVSHGAGREWREAAEPLRSAGRRLTGDGRGLEPSLGVVVARVVGVVGVVSGGERERLEALQVLGHAAEGLLEHRAHLAGLQVTEGSPRERLAFLLSIGAVEKDGVEVRVQAQSDEVRCTTVTAPLLATAPPSAKAVARAA